MVSKSVQNLSETVNVTSQQTTNVRRPKSQKPTQKRFLETLGSISSSILKKKNRDDLFIIRVLTPEAFIQLCEGKLLPAFNSTVALATNFMWQMEEGMEEYGENFDRTFTRIWWISDVIVEF
jgi:hypothetical protein